MTKLTIDLPKKISGRIRDLLAEIQSEVRIEAERAKIIEDDTAMIRAFRYFISEEGWNGACPPIVRAEVYGKWNPPLYLQFRGYLVFELGGRAPVIMRGSRYAMEKRYAAKSGIGYKIAQRFLRRIKFTALTREACEKMEWWLAQRLRENGWYVHHDHEFVRWFNYCPRADLLWGDVPKMKVWIGGHFVEIDAVRYEEALREAQEDREANRVRNAIKKQRAELEYREKSLAKTRELEKLHEEKANSQKRRAASARARRAAEIAALELISEIGGIQK